MDIDTTAVEATVTNLEDVMKRNRRQQIYKIAAKAAVIVIPVVAVLYFLTKDTETEIEMTEES